MGPGLLWGKTISTTDIAVFIPVMKKILLNKTILISRYYKFLKNYSSYSNGNKRRITCLLQDHAATYR